MDRSTTRQIVVAGILGGCAELAWVLLYAGPSNAAGVGREVAQTLSADAGASTHALGFGIAIHLALSVLLALVYRQLVWKPLARRLNRPAQFAIACATLAVVWLVNFFVVLPGVNPAFAELLPYSVTLASKLMFGLAMTLGLVLTTPHANRSPGFAGLLAILR